MNELLRLHRRLTLDRSQAFTSTGQGWNNVRVSATPQGKEWLKDFYLYGRLYKKLNKVTGGGKSPGPADHALNKAFGFVLDEEVE